MSDSEQEVTTTSSNVDTSVSYLGRVKWFNNKAGYGFVTVVSDGDRSNEDVFVHHSGVVVESEQYKYLVQGEYVSFSLKESDNSDHPYQANNLRGIGGGLLMCETRNEQRQQRYDDESDEGAGSGAGAGAGSGGRQQRREDRGERRGDQQRTRHSSSHQTFRIRGAGPREDDNAVWTLVREDRDSRPRRPRRRRDGRDD